MLFCRMEHSLWCPHRLHSKTWCWMFGIIMMFTNLGKHIAWRTRVCVCMCKRRQFIAVWCRPGWIVAVNSSALQAVDWCNPSTSCYGFCCSIAIITSSDGRQMVNGVCVWLHSELGIPCGNQAKVLCVCLQGSIYFDFLYSSHCYTVIQLTSNSQYWLAVFLLRKFTCIFVQ